MYFSHWKPPGVSERMWSVNLDASISGEYQTLEGHSCRNWERRRQAWEHLGAPATCLGAPRITVMNSVCILIYVSMYLYNYPSTHAISGLAGVCRMYTRSHPVHFHYPCISVQPLSLLEDECDRACLRCSWRRRSSELRDALGGRDRASLEMHLEAMIVGTCRPKSKESGDTLGGHDQASLETHLEAVIERDWTTTWRRSMDGVPGLKTLVS